MPSPKRRSSEAQTPTKSPAAVKGTPTREATTPSPSSAKKKSSNNTTPAPKAERTTLPSTSPAPRAPPTTPVAHGASPRSAKKSKSASAPSPAKRQSTSAVGEEAVVEQSTHSMVLDTAEPVGTTRTRASASRKRAHSSPSPVVATAAAMGTVTPTRSSRLRLQKEAEEDEEASLAGQEGPAAAEQSSPHPFGSVPAAVSALLATSTTSKTAVATGASPASSAGRGELRSLVERTVLQTSTIAPDVSGIRCFAFNRREDTLVVAREDGSLIAYDLAFHQNIPHFTQRRHSGGCLRRTITRLAFVRVPVHDSEAAAALGAHQRDEVSESLYKEYVLASYLSGQLVFLDVDTLFPVSVHQRTGGAVWDYCVVPDQPVIYAATADGSWRQLLLTLERYTPQQSSQQPSATGSPGQRLAWRPSLVLERIVPGVPGADRALSVSCAPSLRLVVGTDDAGNVHAWRLRRAHADVAAEARRSDASGGASLAASAVVALRGGLVDHENAWTTRLPKGIPLCCAISSAECSRPAVAVGTSVGDVVLLDAETGDVFATFSQHKGPVSTITFDRDAFYASGWHDSLRAYRFTAAVDSEGGNSGGEWYPAEVKRRTHYHETTQVCVLPQRQLLLSSSRDGTLMYAALSQVFTAPAMYLRATKQQFALCADKNVLVQTRLNRVEAFRMDNGHRHWSPLFAYTMAGHFHISHLWTDPALHYMVIATDDRVVLLKVCWRAGAEAALVVSRLEEVRVLPAACGVLDVCFVPGINTKKADTNKDEEEAEEEVSEKAGRANEGNVYLLYDDSIVHISLISGYPVVRTSLAQTTISASALTELRPSSVFVLPQSKKHKGHTTHTSQPSGALSLVVYGRTSAWQCDLTVDGLPNTDTVTIEHGHALALARLVPALSTTRVSRSPAATDTTAHQSRMLVGLSAATNRYVYSLVDGAHSDTSASSSSAPSTSSSAVVELPKSLPHDCTFVAYMPIHTADLPDGRFSLAALQRSEAVHDTQPTKARRTEVSKGGDHTAYLLFGYFSKGIIVATRREWRMLHRCAMDTAAPLRDGTHVLYVEHNLERTLEALPLCWKVRRFGN